jgi:hypothetical protein
MRNSHHVPSHYDLQSHENERKLVRKVKELNSEIAINGMTQLHSICVECSLCILRIRSEQGSDRPQAF